jgi:hypothetical protein
MLCIKSKSFTLAIWPFFPQLPIPHLLIPVPFPFFGLRIQPFILVIPTSTRLTTNMPTSSSIASRQEPSNAAADSVTTDEENDQIKAILNHGQSTINHHALEQMGAICALGESLQWTTTNKDGTEVINPQYEEFQSLRQGYKDAYKSIPVKSTEELRSSGWATK